MMTFEEIKDLLNGIKFDNDGNPSNLEYQVENTNVWVKSDGRIHNNLFNIIYHNYNYRIKPGPEYVAYDENDWRKFLGEKFEHDDSKRGILIIDYNNTHVIAMSGGEKCIYEYKYLLRNYSKLDGTPAGKLKVAE